MSLLLQFSLILGLALVVLIPSQRFYWLSPLLLIASGILLGPQGLGLIDLHGDWQSIAEIALGLFMVYLGLQLKLQEVWKARLPIFQQGGILLGITAAIFTSLSMFFLDLKLSSSVVVGLAAALSSTSLIIAFLQQKQLSHSRLGQQSYSLALSQTLALIPIIMLIQLLSGADTTYHALAYCMLLLALMSGLLLLNRRFIQPLFQYILQPRTQHFVLAIALSIVLAVLLLSQSFGIHYAIACLIAGMLLADSPAQFQLKHYLKPLKILVVGLFFIVFGATVEFNVLLEQPLIIASAVASLVLIKAAILFAFMRYFKQSAWRQLQLASLFAHAGELSFIVLAIAKSEQLLDTPTFSLLLMVLLLSMLSSPILQSLLFYTTGSKSQTAAASTQNTASHPALIIAGFGRVGQIIARVAHTQQLSFSAIDNSIVDADFVEHYGGKLCYGDATEAECLISAGIEQAQLVVLAIDDIEDSMNLARHLCLNYPHLKVLARARDRHHAHLLKALGIAYIWRESYASSLDMAYQMLCDLGLHQHIAQASIQDFRQHDEQLFAKQHNFSSDGFLPEKLQQNSMTELEHLFQEDIRLQPVPNIDKATTTAQHSDTA